MLIDTNDLITAGEVADICDVTPSAVSNWVARGKEGFPAPVAEFNNGGKIPMRLWDRKAIAFFAQGYLAESIAALELKLFKLNKIEREENK